MGHSLGAIEENTAMADACGQEDVSLLRPAGNQRILIVELPDHFTVRLERVVAKEKIATDHHARLLGRVPRRAHVEYSLDEGKLYAVDL